MSSVLAIAFPVPVIAVVWALFRPGAVVRKLGDGSGPADRSPLPYSTHLTWTLPALGGVAALAFLYAGAQRALFAGAEISGGTRFSYRATDDPLAALTVGIFVALAAVFPLYVRALHWHYGASLAALLDRRSRDRTGLSLRQEVVVMPRLAAAVAIGTVVLNAAAFDTFFRVGERTFAVSGVLDPGTSEYAAADVAELAVHASRSAPNGRIVQQSWLEVRLADGTTIDTSHLLEPEHIAPVIAALQDAADRAIRVTRD